MAPRLTLPLLALAGIASAQQPDVRFRLDIGLTNRYEAGGRASLRTYDTFGRPSVVGLAFYLEPGLRLYGAQRFERLPGGPGGDYLDELYVEDEGIWRLGKQYLPFGFRGLLAETVPAARGDIGLLFADVPITGAVFDGGSGFQRGVLLRVGTPSLALSASYGRHLGISGTALTLWRRPEEAPGKGGGWRFAATAEAGRRFGRLSANLAVITLLAPERNVDDLTLVDAAFAWEQPGDWSPSVGFTYGTDPRGVVTRLGATYPLEPRFILEPVLRFRDSRFYDVGLTVRFRF